MDVRDAIKGRRSIRSFEKKDIPGDAVERLIDAIIWAPSAGNLQSRRFFFVSDSGLKQKIASAALAQTFIASAPLVVVACTEDSIAHRYGERGVSLYCIQDVSASVMSLMLQAHEDGLGSVWVGAFDESEVAGVLGLPKGLRPVAIVPVGYPSRLPTAPKRMSREKAVTFR